MITDILYLLILSTAGGVISLSGGVVLLSNRRTAQILARFAAPFAAGALLASAFTDLLPEAVELGQRATEVFWWTLGGIVAFFLLERFLHWFHHHHEHPGKNKHPASLLVIIGDTVHNFIDGVAIAVAYLVSLPTGIITTFAVAAHEIPQEIGDFGLLLKFGWQRRHVLIINFLSALATVVAALLTLAVHELFTIPLVPIIGITAGFFIYIAASDIIPTIHGREQGKAGALESLLLVAGVLVVGLVSTISHALLEDGHAHDEPPVIEETHDLADEPHSEPFDEPNHE